MSTGLVTYTLEEQGRRAILTIDRAEARNALNDHVVTELLEGATRAAADEAVRVVILTGAGERAFSAGADLDELARRDHLSEVGPVSARRRTLAATLERMPKPTIAAMNGHAVGGGLELALACTFRIAATHAQLGLPEVTLGILPGNGGTQRLARLVGLGRALEMVLTGALIEATEAQRIGLVHQVTPVGEVMEAARALGTRLAALPPGALAAAKETVLAGADLVLDAGLAYENKWFALLCGSPEKQAALSARAAGRGATGEGAGSERREEQ